MNSKAQLNFLFKRAAVNVSAGGGGGDGGGGGGGDLTAATGGSPDAVAGFTALGVTSFLIYIPDVVPAVV